jgi:endonuclease I
MTSSELALWIIVAFLFMISMQISGIASRLKKKFPTEEQEEQEDAAWAKKDPMGHWETHREKTEKDYQ